MSKPVEEKLRKPATTRRDSDIAEMLLKDEEIILSGRIHPAIYWKAVAVALFSVPVALFIAWELGTLLAVVSLLMFVHATALRLILMVVVTNKRLLTRYGLLQIDVVDVHFDKIESIELERMLPGYMFGYSNVVVMGTGQRYIVIPFVANGPAIRRAFNEITLADEDKKKK